MTPQNARVRLIPAAAIAAAVATASANGVAVEICGGAPSFPVATLNAPEDCWEGPSFQEGLTYARANIRGDTDSVIRSIDVYAFKELHDAAISGGYSIYFAQAVGFKADGTLTCLARDDTADGEWDGVDGNLDRRCDETAYAVITAWALP